MKKFLFLGALMILLIVSSATKLAANDQETTKDSLMFSLIKDKNSEPHYIVFQLIPEPILVDNELFASQWKKVAELTYIELNESYGKIKEAYLNPGKLILVRSDSMNIYSPGDRYLWKIKMIGKKFIIYDDRVIRTKYDSDTEYLPAHEVLFFYTALFLAGLGFAFKIRKMVKIAIPILLLSFIPYVYGLGLIDKTQLFFRTGLNLMFLTLPGALILIECLFFNTGSKKIILIPDSKTLQTGFWLIIIAAILYFINAGLWIAYLTENMIAINALGFGLITFMVSGSILWLISRISIFP